MLAVKGVEYALGVDRLAHFKAAGAEQCINAKQALWRMFSKHRASLGAMCDADARNTALWDEKITDSINYLLLLWALVTEDVINEQN